MDPGETDDRLSPAPRQEISRLQADRDVDLPERIGALRAQLPRTMLRDRRQLADGVARLEDVSRPAGARDLGRVAARLDASIARVEQRRSSVPPISYDGRLPVQLRREQIASALAQHNVVIVSGATGSGKSTQLPKICLEAGYGVCGLIGHTQPRRIAAQSLATRLAAEIGTSVGDLVGYQVRFVDRSSPRTLVKLMTDGVLLRELERDPLLERYDALIIDEAHERSLNVDFLLGVCRRLVDRRPELRVLITSATIETQRFAEFFRGAPVIDIEGQTYPVEVRYRAPGDDDDAPTLPEAIATAVEEVQTDPAYPPGDVLVFLAGEKQIRETHEHLQRVSKGSVEVLPLYARLSVHEQERIFAPHPRSRVILATNVAETSLTIPGVRAVIDSGLVRTSRYSPRAKIQRLPIEPVSRASANQRKGRCGREAPGLCLRLYSEADFESRPEFTEPEIRRTNLASLILQMAALGLGAAEHFEFIDPPDHRLLNDGYRLLQELRAVDDKRAVTRLGRQMAALPCDPRVARTLIEASRLGCLVEALTIASFLSLPDPRERPADRSDEADERHAEFADPRSDFVTVLNLWRAYAERESTGVSASRRWCRERFLAHRRMREWQDLREQLDEMCAALQLRTNAAPGAGSALHQALLAGFIGGIGVLDERREYLGARDSRFVIAPGTPLAKRRPHWIVAASLVETERLYARMVAQVQPSWIEAAGAHLVKRSYSAAEWSVERGQVLARETVSLYGRVLSSGRLVDFGRVDPGTAHAIFVEEALLRRQSHLHAAFLDRNERLRAGIEAIEAKLRRRDLLAQDAVLADFYAARIPVQVSGTRAFERWWSGTEREQPGYLDWPPELVAAETLPASDPNAYPDRLDLGGNSLELAYHYDPTSPLDGVTVRVPLPLLETLPTDRLDWLIPGYVRDKVTALLRALPKEIRRAIVPIPEFADRFVASVALGVGSLHDQLGTFVAEHGGVRIDAAQLARAPLPDWLRLRIVVVDAEGHVVRDGRDLDALRAELRTHRDSRPTAAHPWLRDDVRHWDFGEWPVEARVETAGFTVTMYPAIEDVGHCVRLKLDASPASALATSRRGVARLAVLSLSQQHDYVRRSLERDRELTLLVAAAGFGRPLFAEIADRAVRAAVLDPLESLPRTEREFSDAVDRGRSAIAANAEAIVGVLRATLQQLRETRARLEALGAPPFERVRTDIERHLDRLFAPGWVRETPRQWFERYPKYAEAAARRAERARWAASRHAEIETQIDPFDAALRELDLGSPATAEAPARLQLRWMIEEFRISLYAQELRTHVPVSAARLTRQLAEARREAAGG